MEEKINQKLPITFLNAEPAQATVVDSANNSYACENDTLDQGSGDSDTY